MSLACNGQAIFLSFINYRSTYRAYPVIFVFFHVSGTATRASRDVGVDLIHSYPLLTISINSFAGLNAGISWAGIMTVVFLEILRAVLSALCLMMKEPKPRRNTSSPFSIEVLIVFIKLSTTTTTSFVGKPVLDAISLTISIFVIRFCFIIRKRSAKVMLLC